jgi:hypothetical protein
MVVHYLNVGRVSLVPFEADSILLVDPNAVLPESVASQCFQVVAARRRQIVQPPRCVQSFQFPPRRALDMPQCGYVMLFEKSLCAGIAKALDHADRLARFAVTVKQ